MSDKNSAAKNFRQSMIDIAEAAFERYADLENDIDDYTFEESFETFCNFYLLADASMPDQSGEPAIAMD